MTRIEAGIPLVHDPSEDSDEPWQARVPMGPQPTHRAYPEPYAVALEAVVRQARALDAAQEAWISTYNEFGEENEESGTAAIAHADAVIDLKAALDALAAAGSES